MPTPCHHRSLQIPDGNSRRNRIIQSCDKIPFSNGLSEWLDGGFLCNFINSPRLAPSLPGDVLQVLRLVGQQSVHRRMAVHCLLVRPELGGEEAGDESHEQAWHSLKNSPELCSPLQETLTTCGWFFFFKIFFLFYVGHFYSLYWSLLQYCFCFMFWFFGPEACGNLSYPTRDRTSISYLLHWKAKS